MKKMRIPMIMIRIALGGLFIYGGVGKFMPETPQETVQQHNQARAQHDPAQHAQVYRDKAQHDQAHHNESAHDEAKHDQVYQDKTKHDETYHNENQQEVAQHDRPEHDTVYQNKAQHDQAYHSDSTHSQTMHDKVYQSKTQHDQAYHEQVPQEKICATQARNEEKVEAYIGGLKQAGYFWPMLALVELLCGLLLLTQRYALFGAVMLVPITLNILLFHAFLETHEVGELFTTALYFLANLSLLVYDYPKLKAAFLDAD